MRRERGKQTAAEQCLGCAGKPAPRAVQIREPRKAAEEGRLRHPKQEQVDEHRRKKADKEQIENAKTTPFSGKKPPFHDTRPLFFVFLGIIAQNPRACQTNA